MKKVLKYIETDLGIKFEGSKKDFDEVHSFIDEHIDKWREFKDSQPPSEGQLKGVKIIEDSLGITYNGLQTRKEISEFLSEHLEEAMEAKKERGSKLFSKENSQERDPFDEDG